MLGTVVTVLVVWTDIWYEIGSPSFTTKTGRYARSDSNARKGKVATSVMVSWIWYVWYDMVRYGSYGTIWYDMVRMVRYDMYYVIASESARALSTQAQLYYGIASAEHASDLP